MKIELAVIEDLGIKLYTQIPPALSEIIANSWDADSPKVEVRIPVGPIRPGSEIVIEDRGIGMTYEQIQEKYLRIGRKRREEESQVTRLKRRVMGSKGIGKLSGFGVARVVQVDTVQNHKLSSFEMKLDDILADARTKGTYEPKVLAYDKKVKKESGTTVRLKDLKRATPIDIESVRRNIARFFAVLGRKFHVLVNGTEVTPNEKFKEEKFVRHWDIDEAVDQDHPSWVVTGRISATADPLDEKDRGVVVMARGKLVQLNTFFDVKVGEKYTYSYLVGRLDAEFLDQKEDLISTNRQSILWDSPQGLALTTWGQKRLRQISEQLNTERREKRESVIREDPAFKDWLKKLDKPEAAIANKVIGIITSNEVISDDRRKELASFMKESFEQKAFKDLVANMGPDPENVKLLEMFETWDVIEAREILRLVKGRIEVIERFEKLVKTNAREVPTMHDYFKKWPWILDPTWTRWQDEVWYSDLLRQHFPEAKLQERNRRVDFVCIGVGDTVHVIELKRPGHRVNSEDIDQLIDYTTFVKERLGTDKTRGYRDAAGYIVAGERSNDRVTTEKIKLIENKRMYVRRYDDLVVTARNLHAEFEEKLEEFEKSR